MSEAIVVSGVLGGFGLIITLIYSYKNTQLAKDKMSKELFTEFNITYKVLNEHLSLIKGTCDSLDKLDGIPVLRDKLNEYFDLCAEEFYWKDKGRIDDKIWAAWSEGMNDWYNGVPVIREAWEREIKERGCKSYYIKSKDDFFKLR